MSVEPTVFVVDDDRAVRDSLQALAESVGYPVETFDSAQTFLDTYDSGRAGCLVLDIRMRGMNGLELQDELRKRDIPLPVVIVTGYGDIPMTVRAMRAGAIDFIEKPYRDQVLLDRIQQAIDKDRESRQSEAIRQAIRQKLSRLTPRENQVLELVMQGKTNKQIAAEIGVGLRSVESHRARVMERMEVESVAQLVQKIVIARNHIPQG